jgi:small subunit ribosomal protein S17
VVLIQELPEKLTTYITHKVLKVVYPLGDVTDPITNKKVAGLRCGSVRYRFVLSLIIN